jgi:CPA1 family monovalent cation:H+ antiporter
MYYSAEHFHFSGVLAVVSGGLLLSSKRQKMLTYKSRLQQVNVWTSMVYVLHGLVFFLIGLQLPSIIQQLGDISLNRAIWYGLAISLALILVRFICTFGASLFTRFMSHFITVADRNPGWKGPIALGWAGMRGVVSLAAALSIPLVIRQDQPFPYRNLILFITFIVILVTLVLQGLTLPWVIRKLKLDDNKYTVIPEERQEMIIQKKIAQHSLQCLEEKYGADWSQNERLNNLSARLRIDVKHFNSELEDTDTNGSTLKDYQQFYLELLEQQRKLLEEMNQRAEFDEEIIRKYLSLIDLEEFKLRQKYLKKKSG